MNLIHAGKLPALMLALLLPLFFADPIARHPRLHAQEAADASGEAGNGTEEEDAEEQEEKDEIRSIRETRKQTLAYGIDSQVHELIQKLKDEENDRYNDRLVELFSETKNQSIKKELVTFFDKMEDDALSDDAKKVLSGEWDELNTELTVALTNYLKPRQDEELSDIFLEMSDAPRSQVANEAIRALGGADREKYEQELRKIYESETADRSKRSAALEALGEIESEASVPMLSEIVLDEDEEKGLRWKACVALGNIGTEKALETVMKVMEEEDPRLRQFAVQALGKFGESEEIIDMLIQSLKDNNWRVRVEAARSLGEMKSRKAVEILKYKAEHDPDTHNVRTAAVRALGKTGKAGAHDFLRELYRDSETSLEIRGTSIEILVEHDLSASKKVIEEVMKEEWDKENSRILDYTCKQLSTKKAGGLKSFYAQMLAHPDSINLHIYALRGIRLNKIGSLSGEVEKLTGDNAPRPVRSLAITVLDEL